MAEGEGAAEAAGEGSQGGSSQGPSPMAPPPAAPIMAPLGGFWGALFVALVAALVAWLWYGRRDGEEKKKEEKEEEGPPLPPPPPQAQEADTESNQRSYESLIPEAKQTDVSSSQEPVENQLASSGVHCAPSVPDSPGTKPSVKEPTTPLMNYKEYLRTEAFTFPTVTSEPSPNQESEMHGGGTSMEAGASTEKLEERCKEQLRHSVDREEWEIVPEHSEWGNATRKSSVDDASNKDIDLAKRVAAVSPMPQTVHVTFRVHYITHSEAQLIAVTGDHECLGQWHHYVPLRCDKDGFWSDSVVLPVDTQIEWKFIVVENGKVRRWEECDNRTLMTEHEDRVAHKWWGYH